MCLPIVAGVVSGIGAVMSLGQQENNYEAEAMQRRRQGEIERMKGAYEAERTQDEISRAQGTARAGMAANGVDISSGSAADVLTDTEAEGALDVNAIRFGTQVNAENEEYLAKVAKYNARETRKAKPFAFLSPVISGAAKYSSQFA